MAIRKNGEILWIADRGLLISVDHALEKFKDIGISNSTSDWHHNPLYVNSYKRSPVLLDKSRDCCAGDICEESFDSQKREPKGGRKKFLKPNVKKRLRIASLLYISGAVRVKKKGKWLLKKDRK
ncbi:hypothetical protein HAX54_028688 [Datura stramonium]|uniref:Uncharacterized protein n=1 Tax=Datura stramonium TaxID=4076 RepID=A0ABS8S9U6_DATST|nr:hypothetical protein [Datura stramonium]